MIQRRLAYPCSIGLGGAPTYQQMRATTMRAFIRGLHNYGIPYTRNKRPHNESVAQRLEEMGITDFRDVITTVNGSVQIFRSLGDQAFDAQRGSEYADITIDEAHGISYECFQVLAPCLRGHGEIPYQIYIPTTPNGFDWVYDIAVDSGSERYVKDSEWIHATSYDNPFNPSDYVENLLGILTDRMVEQEVFARFVSMDGSVWPELDPRPHPNGNLLPWKFDAAEEVRIAIDWGYRSPAVLLLQRIRFPREWGIVNAKGAPISDADIVVDEYLPIDIRTEELIQWLRQRKVSNPYNVEYLYGKASYDPAGGQVNDQSGTSNAMLLSKAGFRLKPLASKGRMRSVAFGCQVVGSRWQNALGERRLFIACKDESEAENGRSSRCPGALRAFQSYSYKQSQDDKPLDEKPVKGGQRAPDHPADALRYDQMNHHGASSILRGGAR